MRLKSSWYEDLLKKPKAFWVVESLLDKRTCLGRQEYLVHWEGFSHAWDTWEPRSELEKNAKAMVYEFERINDPDCDMIATHCICQKPYRFKDGAMIQCDECKGWYHFRCINMTIKDANKRHEYRCRGCRKRDIGINRRVTRIKAQVKNHRNLMRPTFYSESSTSCHSSAGFWTPRRLQ